MVRNGIERWTPRKFQTGTQECYGTNSGKHSSTRIKKEKTAVHEILEILERIYGA